jgi:hypothetical protein
MLYDIVADLALAAAARVAGTPRHIAGVTIRQPPTTILDMLNTFVTRQVNN